MCGIEAAGWAALSGLNSLLSDNPGRCPGLAWRCPFGAQEMHRATRHTIFKAPTVRTNHSPEQRPGLLAHQMRKALKGRSNHATKGVPA
jgi:hypothetical protein